MSTREMENVVTDPRDTVDGPRSFRRGGSALLRGARTTLLVLVIDQITKAAADLSHSLPLIAPTTNGDYSFGLSGGSPSIMVWTTLACLLAFGGQVVRQATRRELSPVVPGLLVGGAASNLVDRLTLGAVRDFIATPWVVLNVADIAVLAGVSVYVWHQLCRRTRARSFPR